MDSIVSQANVIDAEVVAPKEPPSKRDLFVKGLRDLAEFYEAHPELPLSYSSIDLMLFPELGDMRKYVSIFGKMKKDVIGDIHFQLTKDFFRSGYHHISLSATWNRDQVCEKVKTGTKKVKQTVQTKPAETVEVEVEVETFEWKCPKIAAPPAEFVEGE